MLISILVWGSFMQLLPRDVINEVSNPVCNAAELQKKVTVF